MLFYPFRARDSVDMTADCDVTDDVTSLDRVFNAAPIVTKLMPHVLAR